MPDLKQIGPQQYLLKITAYRYLNNKLYCPLCCWPHSTLPWLRLSSLLLCFLCRMESWCLAQLTDTRRNTWLLCFTSRSKPHLECSTVHFESSMFVVSLLLAKSCTDKFTGELRPSGCDWPLVFKRLHFCLHRAKKKSSKVCVREMLQPYCGFNQWRLHGKHKNRTKTMSVHQCWLHLIITCMSVCSTSFNMEGTVTVHRSVMWYVHRCLFQRSLLFNEGFNWVFFDVDQQCDCVVWSDLQFSF